jgi:hypothetical protein
MAGSDVYTPTVCVCERDAPHTRVGGTPEPLTRPFSACMSEHTRPATTPLPTTTTTVRIQIDYIQQTNGERKGECIHIDYTGGRANE